MLVVVGWGSSASAWDTTAGSDTNYGSINFGGTSNDYTESVGVDGAGNVYTTGFFAGTVDFGAGDVTSNGSFDVFVSKFNSAGAHQWTNTFGGVEFDRGNEMAVDAAGNVHVIGTFDGTVDFGGSNIINNGNVGTFVTKLNSSGAHQWTTHFYGLGYQTGYAVAVDSSGNVYTTGSCSGTTNFGGGNIDCTNDAKIFITKLNSSGTHQWSTTLGSTDSQAGFGVAADGSSNVYVTGYFYGTVNFGAGNVTSAGTGDGFVTKLNSSGVHQWTNTFGGTGDDRGLTVAVDAAGNVHIAGTFQGTAELGAGDVTSAGATDAFVTKLNSAGAHQWTTTLGGTSSDHGNGVAVDGSGNVHIAGTFQGTADLGAGDVTSAGQRDAFVVKLNSAGQAVVAPGGGGGGGGGGIPAAPPAPCPWATAAYAYQSECVEPLKGGISVDADGTLFTVGDLDVTGVTIDLEDGETATDIELVSGASTTGYVLTSKQRIIGFGDTPATDPAGKDLVTLWPGETVTQLSNNRHGTYFATSHGRVFDINGNPYVDLSRYVTTNNIVDIKTLDSGSGILIGADGSVFNFGVDLFQGSLGGQGVTNIIGGHLVSGGYYLLSATGTIHTFGDIAIAPNITTATTKSFDTDTLNAHIIDVAPAGTGLCALGADGGLFDMLGAQHNTVLRAHTNPNTTAIDTTG